MLLLAAAVFAFIRKCHFLINISKVYLETSETLIGASGAFMLGRLTQDAVSAVSLANQIVFVMNLFIGAVTGAGDVLIAQYWSKKDRTMVTKATKSVVIMANYQYSLSNTQ